jgi:dTDP-4-amino-4,6-dideoxygalactose transaminase
MSEHPWKVPLADLEPSAELAEVAAGVVASGWWSMGPHVQEFERAFSEFSGARHALAVANGTAALHLALLALECGPGDEVVVPSLTFVAAANAIRMVGATPVFCDIVGDGDLNMDPADVEKAVSPATKAFVVLHYGGFPCEMDALVAVANRHGIRIVEDAAHAPGSSWRGRSCGTIGDVGCFSFFSNKNLPVGEGGMLVTDDEDLAERLRLLRSHGMTSLTWDRHRGHASSYDVVLPGFNYRLDELRAAMGVVQLRRLPEANAARARIAARYREDLEGSGVTMAFSDRLGDASSAHHLAVALVPDTISRDGVRAALGGRGIQTSLHYPPIHQFSAYRAIERRRSLPKTESAARQAVTLPLFAHMTDEQVDLVIHELVDALGRSEQSAAL